MTAGCILDTVTIILLPVAVNGRYIAADVRKKRNFLLAICLIGHSRILKIKEKHLHRYRHQICLLCLFQNG